MRRLSTREKSGPPQYLPGVPLNPSSSGKYAVKGHPGAQQPIAAQPQIVYVQGPEVISEKEAPDHLIMSILVTIFCCLPFGIAGMLKASDCRNARMRGDRENALLYGRAAKKYAMIGLGIGIVLIIVVLALFSVALALFCSYLSMF